MWGKEGTASSPSHLCLSKVPEIIFLCLLVKTESLSHWASDLMSEKSKFQVENSGVGWWSWLLLRVA